MFLIFIYMFSIIEIIIIIMFCVIFGFLEGIVDVDYWNYIKVWWMLVFVICFFVVFFRVCFVLRFSVFVKIVYGVNVMNFKNLL